MGSSTPIIYWDTCVFLAWIKDETRAEGEMAGVYAVVLDVMASRARLITSVITREEIQLPRLNADQLERFTKVFDRTNVKTIPMSDAIATKAGQLRHHYQTIGDGRPPLCKEDARHLATAIIYAVSVFHTFDEADKKGCRGLLGLNGNVAGHALKIAKPESSQPILDLKL